MMQTTRGLNGNLNVLRPIRVASLVPSWGYSAALDPGQVFGPPSRFQFLTPLLSDSGEIPTGVFSFQRTGGEFRLTAAGIARLYAPRSG